MTTIAIIGQGGMARAHARAWRELGLADRIAYVCARGPAVPLDGAPNARFVTDLDIILQDPDIDVVSVCTPTPTHADIAIRCLRVGKNVLLEKPIALSLPDAIAIRDVAEQSDGILMVAHVVRFFPGYRAIREEVEAGVIGSVLTARAQRISAVPAPSTWWHDESRSGGVLVDFSIHDFDQLNLFLGRPLSVSAKRARSDGPFEVAVDYEGGGSGQVLSYMGMPAEFSFASSLELLGSLGLADHHFAGALAAPTSPIAPTSPTAPTSPGGNDAYRLVTGAGIETRAIAPGNPYARQAEYFLNCVRNGSDPTFCPTDSAILALAVSLAARESLAAGRPVLLRTE